MTAPTIPAAAFTKAQLERIDSHTRDLDREIADRCGEQQAVTGHALAVIARAAFSGVETVRVCGVSADGTYDDLVCVLSDGRTELLPLASYRDQLQAVLTTTFRRLPEGPSGIWTRQGTTAVLEVGAALGEGGRYPFLPVHERFHAHLEEQTGRTIRGIEIGTELYENGYFYSEHVDVDYSDGDGDTVYVEDLNEFTDELRHWVGDPGPHTTVTITSTANGITIE
ncbi:hypothetical protein Br6_04829 [Rhodococcus sp. Br-6]|nr:hypothetical protein Br6_04829 [Rhodococcus sp. Br-6]